ncbi:hypothetical protein CANCADRAFT_31036 [Tortispora caseinolytica NRRL Y-17796]|uniref:Uncharacterized protein n=1 Tax=Tortispora caseinolytica NRRL Y-17796 TaxID=767744 RepID=A0A1E4TE02_9ASCO|nr:hypothetical protein CANCADRAFT_31036 [Tortispora caseinolytica NRRL Y-17796]
MHASFIPSPYHVFILDQVSSRVTLTNFTFGSISSLYEHRIALHYTLTLLKYYPNLPTLHTPVNEEPYSSSLRPVIQRYYNTIHTWLVFTIWVSVYVCAQNIIFVTLVMRAAYLAVQI